MDLKNSPYILLVIATFLWGGNFVVGSQLVAHIPPITLALLRWITALLILLPLYGRDVWDKRDIILRHWRAVCLLAVTGVFAFNTVVYIAVQHTTSINASLMNSATPIIIVMLSLIFLQERLTITRMLGIWISLIGVLWIISRGSIENILGLAFNRGDLWMLLAVTLWAIYSIIMKKYAGTLPTNELFAVTVLIAVLLLLPFSAVEWMVGNRPTAITLQDVGGVLYIGLFASLVAFYCWNRAVALIGPSRSAIFLNLIPLFSAILAILFTGESIHIYHGVGAILVIGGVYLTARKRG